MLTLKKTFEQKGMLRSPYKQWVENSREDLKTWVDFCCFNNGRWMSLL